MVAFLGLPVLVGCGATMPPEVVDVQKAVDAGGTVRFPAGTYFLTQTIVVRKSNTIIQGAGPQTVFVFKPSPPRVHCANDRAFTTPCDVVDTARRRITGPIAIGDNWFTALDNVDDLDPGDWLIVEDIDRQAGDVVVVDCVQVATTSGNTVTVKSPFRTAFPNERPWDQIQSGLGFYVLPPTD
jgi:hypothetical protein